MNDDIPAPHIERPSKGKFAPAVLVWLVPLAALIVAGLVAWQTINARGPQITISFAEASGVIAGETEVRYRDVQVGVVEEVGFTDGLDRVLLTVRLDKDVAGFADDDAEFWIVRPEVTTRGISGLNTVLSGVYIEANWDSTDEGVHADFVGLDRAPLSAGNREGLSFVLRSRREGGLAANTPILYKGIEVGRVGEPRITGDGSGVEAEAFIDAPHDGLITTATRFWDTSGITFSLGPSGAQVDFESIASLVSGGIAFQTIVSGGEPPEDGTVFEVYPDESTARNSIFEQDTQQVLSLSVVFSENVSGLETEAPVELNGIRVGQVTNLTGLVDEERFGDTRVRLVAVLDIGISRLGLPQGSTREDALAFLQEKVTGEGLRARLTNASLLTGGLKVELARVPEAPAAAIEEAEPFPIFPTAESAVEDMSASAEDVLRRVEKLPVEELMQSAIDFLNASTALVRNEDLNGTPAAIRAILADVDAVTGSDAVQALPDEVQGLVASLRDSSTDMQAAIADLRSVVAGFEAADVPQRTVNVLDAAQAMAGDISTVAQGVPALVDEFKALAADARSIPFQELSARLDTLLATADTFLGDEALAALPADLSSTLAEARTMAAELRGLVASEGVQAIPDRTAALLTDMQGAVGDLRATLNEFRETGAVDRLVAAVDATTEAADGVTDAVAGLPELIADLQAVAGKAGDLPLAQLTEQLTGTLGSAQTLLDSSDTQSLPAALNDALAELEGILADIRGGEAIDNASKAFAAAEGAASSIEAATADLPTLIRNANAVLAQANATLAALDGSSELSREARSALREVSRAASAVSSLARTIERRPNSILLGR